MKITIDIFKRYENIYINILLNLLRRMNKHTYYAMIEHDDGSQTCIHITHFDAAPKSSMEAYSYVFDR